METNYSNRGKKLEANLYKALKLLKMSNEGIFFKSYTPMIISGENKTTVTFSKKALGDFYGIYSERFILIECKQTKNKSLPLSNIKKEQIRTMKNISSFGGYSLFVIWFEKCNTHFAIGINAFDELIKGIKDKQSINIDDLKKYGYQLEVDNHNIINIQEFLNIIT